MTESDSTQYDRPALSKSATATSFETVDWVMLFPFLLDCKVESYDKNETKCRSLAQSVTGSCERHYSEAVKCGIGLDPRYAS